MTKPATQSEAVDTRKPPLDTRSLRRALAGFLKKRLPDGANLGACKGVYMFYDYDGEPIYVGQTVENLSTRIGRHLRGMRSDAVGKGVLDPYEVRTIKVWPSSAESLRDRSKTEIARWMNDLEFTVYEMAVTQSKFGAILNEKPPTGKVLAGPLPETVEAILVAPEVEAFRSHPDVRLGRRALTIARLAQVIAEREVKPELRKVLLVQAKRLAWLAEQRTKAFTKTAGLRKTETS